MHHTHHFTVRRNHFRFILSTHGERVTEVLPRVTKVLPRVTAVLPRVTEVLPRVTGVLPEAQKPFPESPKSELPVHRSSGSCRSSGWGIFKDFSVSCLSEIVIFIVTK